MLLTPMELSHCWQRREIFCKLSLVWTSLKLFPSASCLLCICLLDLWTLFGPEMDSVYAFWLYKNIVVLIIIPQLNGSARFISKYADHSVLDSLVDIQVVNSGAAGCRCWKLEAGLSLNLCPPHSQIYTCRDLLIPSPFELQGRDHCHCALSNSLCAASWSLWRVLCRSTVCTRIVKGWAEGKSGGSSGQASSRLQ